MSETNSLDLLDEAIEKARGKGLLPARNQRWKLNRRLIGEMQTHRANRDYFSHFAGRIDRSIPQRGHWNSGEHIYRFNMGRASREAGQASRKGNALNRLRRGVVRKSIDALDGEIEKALRINGGVRVSPAQRRELATSHRYVHGRIPSKERVKQIKAANRFVPTDGVNGRAAVLRRAIGYVRNGDAGLKRGEARQLLNRVRQRSANAIHDFRTRRGQPSPYRQKLFGGLKRVTKAKAKTLYVYRPVENAADIISWAKSQGFTSTLPGDKLHVTIVASPEALNWANLFDDYSIEPNEQRDSMCGCGPVYSLADRNKQKVISNGVREVKALGKGVALCFESLSLTERWIALRRVGAASKFSSFQPHITLTLSGGPSDLSKIEPYKGDIVLGEECWEEYDEAAMDGVDEVVTKAALDALNTRLTKLEQPAEAA